MAFNVGVRLQNWVFWFVCLATGLSLAPLVVRVNPNLNVILTACLTVYVGCFRSVKDTPPTVRKTQPDCLFSFFWISSQWNHFSNSIYNLCFVLFGIMQETMSKEHAMRFPLVGSAMLLSLFLLFKFLSKDLVNAVLTAYFFVLGIVALSYVQSILCFWLFLLNFDFPFPNIHNFVFCRATLLPAIRRFLPDPWNDNLIVWRFPYFRCMYLRLTYFACLVFFSGYVWMWFYGFVCSFFSWS